MSSKNLKKDFTALRNSNAVVTSNPAKSDNDVKKMVHKLRSMGINKSNDEIVKILNYYDFNIENAFSAYAEDGGEAALKAWQCPATNKPRNKKGKRKQFSQLRFNQEPSKNEQKEIENVDGNCNENMNGNIKSNGVSSIAPVTDHTAEKKLIADDSAASTPVNNVALSTSDESKQETNQCDQSTKVENETKIEPVRTDHSVTNGVSKSSEPDDTNKSVNNNEDKTFNTSQSNTEVLPVPKPSEVNSDSKTNSIPSVTNKKPDGLIRTFGNLRRQSSALMRVDKTLHNEIDQSYSRLRSVFVDLRAKLDARENELKKLMEKAEIDANDLLKMRQTSLQICRQKYERSAGMNTLEKKQFQDEVKHLVSDRHTDEELASCKWFQYYQKNLDNLTKSIQEFGEVTSTTEFVYDQRGIFISKPTPLQEEVNAVIDTPPASSPSSAASSLSGISSHGSMTVQTAPSSASIAANSITDTPPASSPSSITSSMSEFSSHGNETTSLNSANQNSATSVNTPSYGVHANSGNQGSQANNGSQANHGGHVNYGHHANYSNHDNYSRQTQGFSRGKFRGNQRENAGYRRRDNYSYNNNNNNNKGFSGYHTFNRGRGGRDGGYRRSYNSNYNNRNDGNRDVNPRPKNEE